MVSIIIPVYSVKKEYLDQCLESVLEQTFEDIEVLLVDDGAVGNLPQICDDYGLIDERVKVIHQENAGASAARNAGLEACQGEYVTFVDSDDYISKDTVAEALERIKEDNLDILLWGSYKCYDSYKEKYMPYDEDVRLFEGELKDQLMLKTMAGSLSFYVKPATKFGSGSCCSKLYRTAFLRENGLKYPVGVKRAEDVNFNIRAFDAAKRIGYLNRHFYYYRQHGESATYQYRENGIRVFTQALSKLAEFLKTSDKPELFWQIYYQRCIFFLLESLDMDYLNPENKKPMNQRIAELKEVADSEPYKAAVMKIDPKYLSLPKRIPVFLLKLKWMRLLCVFYSVYKKLG